MMSPEVEKLVKAGKISQSEGEKLSRLTVGSFCLHKSWGAGRIKEWDLLADRMEIDFEGKPGHTMKLGFAAGSLDVLPPEHFRARRVGDLPALKKMAKENPAALVELVLGSHGNALTLDQLESLLSPLVIPSAEYKSWWTAAKKALKNARHVVVPAKRTEPLVLRDSERSHADTMVGDFLAVRDMKGKLSALAAIRKDLDLFQDPAVELLPVLEDINGTVRKAWKLHLKESLQLLMARDELLESVSGAALPEGQVALVEVLREARNQLPPAVNNLPAAMVTRAYQAFPAAFPDREWVQEALAHMTKTGGRAVSELATLLDANDELDVLADFLKKAVRNRRLSTDLLIWMCQERTRLAESAFDLDLGNSILDALVADHVAGGPKKTGRLHDAIADDAGLIGEMVADADEDELRRFARRILGTPVLDELTRRSLMGRIIKARPEMQHIMEEGAATQDASLIVSWESLERRKLDLEDLARNKIPQNKKDIQIAREYGDLRENFEYKSARQQQAVLLRLQSKYERELRHARGTDFSDAKTETVGIGTIVEIEELSTAGRETYTILGAWDGDPARHIISYLSGVAKALIGKAVGDESELPGDESHATRRAKILSIRAYKRPVGAKDVATPTPAPSSEAASTETASEDVTPSEVTPSEAPAPEPPSTEAPVVA
ncbi:MAG TPA: GreA/GreB family elongation factor [Verrucomicrobiaceae bacterium]